MKRVLAFLGSRGVLYLLFVVALLALQSRGLIEKPLQQQERANALRSALPALDRARQETAAEIAEAREQARGRTVRELQQQFIAARKELQERELGREQNARGYLVRSPLNPDYATSDGLWALKVEAALQKVDGLAALRATAAGRVNGLSSQLAKATQAANEAGVRCSRASAQLHRHDRLPWVQREWANWRGEGRPQLAVAQTRVCNEHKLTQGGVSRLSQAVGLAQSARSDVNAWVLTDVTDVAAEVRELAAREQQAVERSLVGRAQRFWREHRMNAILFSAFGLLVLSLVTPYLIRVVFYYVLAPIAERRGAIRLNVPGGGASAVSLASVSGVSAPVRIGADEELLVRQGFLQTTSVGGAKRTVAALDWRHPLMSWLTGLVGLTSVKGEGQLTTVSAIDDPFAEVAELTILQGAALVLHPRALVAVVQPIGRPVRITSHWRLLSLDAWLTSQLRYFVFHGPARLVVRGGRGVRIEPAERGKIFTQDQLVGFSADLSYSVTRLETFFPYFVGRESLLKDRVDGGGGVLVLEEAPLSPRGRPQKRGGLEGAFDAALKALGM